MNADLIKRERIREALTARLLQLSKQCEDICCPPTGSPSLDSGFPVRTKSSSSSYEVEVFKLSFPERASSSDTQLPRSDTKNVENIVNKSDTILPVMINNFVTPNFTEEFTEDHKQDKAFSKDVLNRTSATENRNLCFDSEINRQEIPADSQSECESRLFVTTPSTDLDHYMIHSDTSIHTDRSLSTTSDGTSISEADHVTVVSLTSDTESQDSLKLYENFSQLRSQNHNTFSSITNDSDTLPKVLNEFPVSEKPCVAQPEVLADSAAQLSDTKTPRRRRLSYTLEMPSPVLEKALRNHTVGPETAKQSPVSKTTKENKNMQCQVNPAQSSKTAEQVSTKDTFLSRPLSSRGSFSSRSRIPVMNSSRTNSSPLSGCDQVSLLDRKNQSFRQFLDKINSSLTPLCSPKHDRHSSSRTESSNSPPSTPVASRIPSLSAELQSLRDEIAQQRQLLTEQSQQLEEMTRKQESFFQRMLSAQHQQMAQLQKELSREVHELFAQHSLAVQTKLQNLEACVMAVAEDRPRYMDGNTGYMDETDPGPPVLNRIPDNQVVLSLYNDNTEALPAMLDTINDHSILPYSKPCKAYPNANFDRISAAVKGYLTRRLLKTEKVQGLIQTIKDTMECALNLHEIARSNVAITRDDAELHQRLINQVTSACHAFHDVFFKYSVAERMNLIAQSRQLAREKSFQATKRISRPYISSATIKSLERKKFAKSKSVSPTAGRMRWREPKRASTALEIQRKPNSPVQRSLSVTPNRIQPSRHKQFKGDCRSPSFYM